MKTITTIAMMLSLTMMHQLAFAQNCQGDKVRISKGWKGQCGCHCEKKCVLPGDVQSYLDSGWYLGECGYIGKFCCINGLRIEEEGNVSETSLANIYPNPTSGSVTIAFNLAEQANVVIRIFDVTGRTVATLANDLLEENNEVTWDASAVSPGIYFVEMKAGDYSETKKLSVTQ
jgi:hypothetical protein